jgi:predicted PolB exonuclease-like 3'-5' exonuclease
MKTKKQLEKTLNNIAPLGDIVLGGDNQELLKAFDIRMGILSSRYYQMKNKTFYLDTLKDHYENYEIYTNSLNKENKYLDIKNKLKQRGYL